MINELRIGNYVYTGYLVVKSYSQDGLYNLMKNIEEGTDKIKPIQLTEEWKEKIKDDKNLLIDSIGFVIFKNGYAYQFVFEDYPFLHQIQNLYFALTNEELTFKP